MECYIPQKVGGYLITREEAVEWTKRRNYKLPKIHDALGYYLMDWFKKRGMYRWLDAICVTWPRNSTGKDMILLMRHAHGDHNATPTKFEPYEETEGDLIAKDVLMNREGLKDLQWVTIVDPGFELFP